MHSTRTSATDLALSLICLPSIITIGLVDRAFGQRLNRWTDRRRTPLEREMAARIRAACLEETHPRAASLPAPMEQRFVPVQPGPLPSLN